MKVRNYIWGLFASLAVLASCEPEEELLGPASLKSDKTEVSVPQAGGSETFQLKATRDWKVTLTPEDSGFKVTQVMARMMLRLLRSLHQRISAKTVLQYSHLHLKIWILYR